MTLAANAIKNRRAGAALKPLNGLSSSAMAREHTISWLKTTTSHVGVTFRGRLAAVQYLTPEPDFFSHYGGSKLVIR